MPSRDRGYSPFCTECGSLMSASWSTHDGEGRLIYWRCDAGQGTHPMLVTREWVESVTKDEAEK